MIEVGRRFVERHDPAVDAERFGEREADNDRREHFLSGTAATAHVHLGLILEHDHL